MFAPWRHHELQGAVPLQTVLTRRFTATGPRRSQRARSRPRESTAACPVRRRSRWRIAVRRRRRRPRECVEVFWGGRRPAAPRVSLRPARRALLGPWCRRALVGRADVLARAVDNSGSPCAPASGPSSTWPTRGRSVGAGRAGRSGCPQHAAAPGRGERARGGGDGDPRRDSPPDAERALRRAQGARVAGRSPPDVARGGAAPGSLSSRPPRTLVLIVTRASQGFAGARVAPDGRVLEALTAFGDPAGRYDGLALTRRGAGFVPAAGGRPWGEQAGRSSRWDATARPTGGASATNAAGEAPVSPAVEVRRRPRSLLYSGAPWSETSDLRLLEVGWRALIAGCAMVRGVKRAAVPGERPGARVAVRPAQRKIAPRPSSATTSC